MTKLSYLPSVAILESSASSTVSGLPQLTPYGIGSDLAKKRDLIHPGGGGPVGTLRLRRGAPETFEPEFSGLEGQCLVRAKLQARGSTGAGALNLSVRPPVPRLRRRRPNGRGGPVRGRGLGQPSVAPAGPRPRDGPLRSSATREDPAVASGRAGGDGAASSDEPRPSETRFGAPCGWRESRGDPESPPSPAHGARGGSHRGRAR
jgi:hypothetical protein